MTDNSGLRLLSNIMKTCGIWICAFGYGKSWGLFGIVLLLLSWYTLDFHYWSEGRKTIREYLREGDK